MEGFQAVAVFTESSMEAVNDRIREWGDKLLAVGLSPDEHIRRDVTRSEEYVESGSMKVHFRCVVYVSDEGIAKPGIKPLPTIKPAYRANLDPV